jgi:hypothetical protein
MGFYFKKRFAPPPAPTVSQVVKSTPPASTVSSDVKSTPPAPIVSSDVKPTPISIIPFADFGLHISGHFKSKNKEKLFDRWVIVLSKDGKRFRDMSDKDLMATGFSFTPLNDCAAWLRYGAVYKRFITCDASIIQVVTK